MPVTFNSCNANHITNKMPTLVLDTLKERLDVIHITEAGLKQQLLAVIKGYKALTHVRPEHSRGSVIWVRDCYNERI